jgi:hypothetical protein
MMRGASLNAVRRFLFAVQTYAAANLVGDNIAFFLTQNIIYLIVYQFDRELPRLFKIS